MVYVLFPVSIVMILFVIVIFLVCIEEFEIVARGIDRLQQGRRVVTVLLCFHHIIILWLCCHSSRYACSDARCKTCRAVCLYLDDTIGTTCTIEGCSITDNGYVLYVSRIYIGEDVVNETAMKHLTTILLFDDNTIYHNQWLCVGIKGVQSLHEDIRADTWSATALCCISIGTKLLLNLLLDVKCI